MWFMTDVCFNASVSFTHTLCAARRAPDKAYNCDICYNKTTRTRFWGFVSCIVKLDNLASGKDARLVELTDLVSTRTEAPGTHLCASHTAQRKGWGITLLSCRLDKDGSDARKVGEPRLDGPE